MSFPIDVPQVCIIAIAIGSIVYVYYMIRASAQRLRLPMKEQEEETQPHPLLPQPQQFSNNQPRGKRLFHPNDTPVDKKLKQIETAQQKQTQHLDEVDARIRELKAAISMKPESNSSPSNTSPKKKLAEGNKENVGSS